MTAWRPPRPERTIVFFDEATAPGWRVTISIVHRKGFDPCVKITTTSPTRSRSIIFHAAETSAVLDALARAPFARGIEETGRIKFRDGAFWSVRARREHGYRARIEFQLVNSDGSLKGKPRAFFGDALHGLGRATAALAAMTSRAA